MFIVGKPSYTNVFWNTANMSAVVPHIYPQTDEAMSINVKVVKKQSDKIFT